ncbi:MAG: AAA family ATPase [Caulobacteraceae bacterium]
MNLLKCKLFGTPEIYKDGEKIIFPFKKAEALFYYLIVKKQAFRDVLVDLLWGSVEEEVAKKSLRNAVYIINKALDGNVLISPKRAIIMLNPEIVYEKDLDLFLGDDGCGGIEAYSGEFLEGFLVKDADSFEKWMLSMRNQYCDVYANKLHKQIQICIKEKRFDEVEIFCKSLIKIDEFNEKSYRILMNVYRRIGQYDKCIEVYNSLSELLKNELSITPDTKTNELLGEIVKEKTARQVASRSEADMYFYGRQAELEHLNGNLYNFITGKGGKSVIILGEAGLGKTTLVSKLLKDIGDVEAIVLKTNCYQAEESYLLKPWNDILYQLSVIISRYHIEIPVTLQRIVGRVFPGFAVEDEISQDKPIEQIDILKYQVAEKAIIDIFKKVSEKKKTIIVFEDIQWIDSMSLSLMWHIMQDCRNQSLAFIITSRTEHGGMMEKFIIDAKAYALAEILELERFSREETVEFACGAAPELSINDELGDSIYKETEGNTFFIVEFLNNLKGNKSMYSISPKMQDILKSRFLNVSEEGRKILNITSVFFDKVMLEELLEVSGKSELELMDIISELEEKNLLKEMGESEDVGFVFTHQKLREFVYTELTASKKKILHKRIARLLESRLKGDKRDVLLYSKLIHHFKNGGNRLQALKYTIKNLECYLGISHEMFPVFYDEEVTEKGIIELSEEQVESDLQHVRELIKEIKEDEGYDKELERLEFSFMHMVGRGYIRSGDYQKGLGLIEQMTSRAVKAGDSEFALKGYKQMVYFCINTFNTRLMDTYVEEALKIAERNCIDAEKCILLRLRGMQRVMDGRFAEGEEILKKAISLFEALEYKDKYILNIAACYNFIGEAKRRSMEFYSSIEYYDRAISICEEKGLIRGLPVFNTNAGQAAYDMGEYTRAKKYLQKAIDAYLHLNMNWGRSTAYGYMSLIHVRDGNYDDAMACLIKANGFAELMQSPYETALIYRIKAEIRKVMEFVSELSKVFSSYLDLQVSEYCDEGLKQMKGLKGCYELDILKNLKESWA